MALTHKNRIKSVILGIFQIAVIALCTFFTNTILASSLMCNNHYLFSPENQDSVKNSQLGQDSSSVSADTAVVPAQLSKTNKTSDLDAPVVYTCDDSMAVEMGEVRKVYLWKNVVVTYKDIELKADYVEFNMDSQTVFAKGLPDSTGKIVGRPVFKQGNQQFESDNLFYNFKTRKGYIKSLRTNQEGGVLHADITKRLPNGDINLKGGKYTTCDAEHPHFYIELTKAISVPGDKIVSGPAYIVLEDVPLPIGIPFGFFPNTRTSASGILLPTYGEEMSRGFYLRNGGYYIALNDHVDLRIQGDIYTKGTWGVNATTNYRKRYAFSGSFSGRFYQNITSEKDLPDFRKSNDFSIQWSHRQDPKANPTRTFGANVNFSSSSFDRNHSYNIENYLNTTKSSSISYSKIWPGSPFNLTAGINHSQNSSTKSVNLSLPNLTFNMSAIYPFRNIGNPAKDRFWKNIQLTYSSALQNNITTTDSLLFTKRMFENMQNGYRHNIPLSFNFKPINGFNITPSLNYTGYLYTSQIRKYWDPDAMTPGDTIPGAIVTDTITGLTYAHALYPALSITVNPKIYGMFAFRKGSVKAIRHVISPSASFSYVPDVRGIIPSYYRSVRNEKTGDTLVYSIYDNNLWRSPSANGRSASLSLSLRNTLEMKYKPKNDTSETLKKAKILENFDFSTSYNPYLKKFRWSDIRFNTGNSFFNGKMDARLSASFDPYQLDSAGIRINRLEVSDFGKSHRIARLKNAQLSVGLRLQSAAGKKSSQQQPGQNNPMVQDASVIPPDRTDAYELDNFSTEQVNFNIPWSFRLDYSFSYSKPAFKSSIVQSLRISGDFSLTPKWKIGMNTGYDFVTRKMTMTNINIHRDLHCWEMSINFIPFGQRKSYSFNINVKSAILRDLKYNKSRSWYDNF